jgi:hypothetical protein
MMRSTTSHAKTFDEHKEQILEAREMSRQQHATASLMCYSDFFRFAADFGLSTMGLTTLDLGDIYLSVVQQPHNNTSSNASSSGADGTGSASFEPEVRKINFSEFWESLVRCALRAFADTKIPTDEKIKGMFLYIWRFIQSSIQDEISGIGTVNRGGFNTYKGGLVRGSQILNERFISAWTKDGYRDYLEDPVSKFDVIVLLIPLLMYGFALMVLQMAPGKANANNMKSSVLLESNRILPGSVMERTLALTLDDASESGAADNSLFMLPLSPARGRSSSNPTQPLASSLSVPNNNQSESKPQSRQSQVVLNINDHEQLGDDRIKPAQLRQLLNMRPDIAMLLKECIDDEGLAELSSDDEN